MALIGVVYCMLTAIAVVVGSVGLAMVAILLVAMPDKWRGYAWSFLIGAALTFAWCSAHATSEIGGGAGGGQSTTAPPTWECVHNEQHRCQ